METPRCYFPAVNDRDNIADAWRRQLALSSAGSTGSARMRLPFAAKIALQIAGAIGGTPGSPTPPGGALLAAMGTLGRSGIVPILRKD